MSGLKLAFRTLTKSPFITAIAAASLALGLGANAAIFSLFDQVLLRSLPVHEPDRLVNLAAPGPNPGSQSCNQAGDCQEVFSYAMFRDLEADGAGFDGVAAHRLFGANVAVDGRTLNGQGLVVSGSYFEVLGLQPAVGRLFGRADDEEIGAHPIAVLSHSYWQTELGGDPSVLNRTIVVNGHPLTIVGVAAPGFDGTTLGGRPNVFVPITMATEMMSGWDRFENRRDYRWYLFARLRGDGSLEQADAEVNGLYSSIINEVEVPLQGNMTEQTMERFLAKQVVLSAGHQGQSQLNREARAPLYFLLAITGFVLVIACANIANLLLVRGARRGQEMAIRSALGGSRTQLLGQLLTESLLLALLGGALSILVARWTLQVVGSLVPAEFSQFMSLGIEPSMVLFTGALSVGTGILFGLYPAIHSTRSDLITVLRVNSAQAATSRAASRYRSTLVTGQIALSMALLVGAGLFIRSLVNVSRVDLGIQTDNMVMFGISPALNGYSGEESLGLYERVEAELAALPGVTAVSAALVPLLGGSSWGSDVAVEGFHWEPGVDANSRFNAVGPGYFSTAGMPLLAGREFTESDVAGAPRAAIVNEAFTRKFELGGRDAVGKFMSDRGGGSEELDIEIVGVVQDAKYNDVKAAVPPLFFLAYKQDDNRGSLLFYVRTAVEPPQIMRAIPEVLNGLDPNLPVEDIKTLEQQIRENVYLDRMISTLAAGFAVLATLLAAIGLYGVLAYTVSQRTREIGVRMALGAGGQRVRKMVLKQVTQMTAIGGLIGLLSAYYLGVTAESLLFELESTDPLVFIGVIVVLGSVAFGAGYLPARKASRVDPVVALRYD